MSTTFILLAFNSVIRRIENIVTDELFLYAGIYLGVAMLFYIPSVVFFIIFLLSFILFSTPVRRRVLLYFYGFLVPLIIAGGYYFWFDAENYFLEAILFSRILDKRVIYLELIEWWPFGLIIGFWLLISLYYTFIKGRHTNFEIKIAQVMFLYLIAGVAAIWLDNLLSPSQLGLFIPSLAFFLTHFVLLIKKKFYRVIIPILIFISTVISPFYFYSKLEDTAVVVPKSELPFVGKKVMLLSDKLELYHDQKIAGPVIDGQLSQRNFKGIDEYHEATYIYESIIDNYPEVIIDDWRIMDRLFFRFPLLKNKYRAGINNRYYLIANN